MEFLFSAEPSRKLVVVSFTYNPLSNLHSPSLGILKSTRQRGLGVEGTSGRSLHGFYLHLAWTYSIWSVASAPFLQKSDSQMWIPYATDVNSLPPAALARTQFGTVPNDDTYWTSIFKSQCYERLSLNIAGENSNILIGYKMKKRKSSSEIVGCGSWGLNVQLYIFTLFFSLYARVYFPNIISGPHCSGKVLATLLFCFQIWNILRKNDRCAA